MFKFFRKSPKKKIEKKIELVKDIDIAKNVTSYYIEVDGEYVGKSTSIDFDVACEMYDHFVKHGTLSSKETIRTTIC